MKFPRRPINLRNYKMKLFDYQYYEDFGGEWYFQLLPIYPRFALIDSVIQWDDYPATDLFPCIIFGIGPYDLFGFSFRFRKLEIRLNFLNFKPRNLEWYRRQHD
jgi:hypothetical protein